MEEHGPIRNTRRFNQGALPSWREENIKGKIIIEKVVKPAGFGAGLRSISYKGDGSRFEVDTTIKLNVNTSYQLSMNFRPVVRIERMQIMGDIKSPSEAARNIESVTYTTFFDTKTKQASKKGKRDKIHIFIDLGEHGTLNLILQAKYYAEKDDNHVAWGNLLHHIEFEATSSEGEVKVSKILFR